jgi:Peptidase family S41
MSEKIYALLLRLYPSAFRKMYGEEAMQLVRDRLREETGFVGRLRLWFDLLVDCLMSLPSEYRHAQPMLSATQNGSDGVPGFHVLEERPLGPGTLLAAVICFLAVLGTLSLLMKQGRRSNADRGMHGAAAQQTRWAASPGASPQLGRNDGQAIVAVAHEPVDPTVPPPVPTSAQRTIPALDASERHRVIEAAAVNLKQHYFDPDRAGKIANALLAHEKNGDNNAILDGPGFAHALTRQMREAGEDVDLTVEYSSARLPDHPQTPDLAGHQAFLLQNHCFFQKVEILPHATGYIQLDGFADLSVCRPAAMKAMASLNHAKAVIFDLRNNRGGDPAMVSFVAAYLFDHPETWYNPRGGVIPSKTQSPVSGNRLADKPVYVLTSVATWSAAEQFTYDLKMLKRATLVGETTGGGAHAGVFHRLDDHFGMGIPEVRVINPYGRNDWEGTGVAPDVNVSATDALATAQKLAQRKLR